MSKLYCTFCGGSRCPYENWQVWLHKPNQHNAIRGVFSNWITDTIVAMARPSDRLIDEFEIVQQFQENDIGILVNLQEKGEHALCGDGITASGFSYTPEAFTAAGVIYYNFGWQDMRTPQLEKMLTIVRVLSYTMQQSGKRAAIHCHAGLGRTGLVIACYLIYTQHMDADQAIAQVRMHRPKSVQTRKQYIFVHLFHDYIKDLRKVFRPAVSLEDAVERQSKYLDRLQQQLLNNVPRLVYEVCERITQLMDADPRGVASNALLAMSKTVFDSKVNAVDECALQILKDQVNADNWLGIRTHEDVKVLVQLMYDWFNCLTDGVIPSECMEILCDAEPNVTTLISALGPVSRDTLSYVVFFLRKLLQKAEMTAASPGSQIRNAVMYEWAILLFACSDAPTIMSPMMSPEPVENRSSNGDDDDAAVPDLPDSGSAGDPDAAMDAAGGHMPRLCAKFLDAIIMQFPKVVAASSMDLQKLVAVRTDDDMPASPQSLASPTLVM